MQTMNTSTGHNVVLLHASASSARQWRDLTLQLQAQQVNVLTPDLYGHGSAPAWPADAPYSLASEARRVLQQLPTTGALHIVGHSYGGAVALKLAALLSVQQRLRLASLVVYEPVMFRWLFADTASTPEARTVLRVAEAMRQHVAAADNAAAAQCFVDFWSGAGSWAGLGQRSGAHAAVASRAAQVVRHFEAAFAEPLLTRELLGLPMLVLHGQQTVPVAQRLALLLRNLFPQAAHQALPSMGHMGPVSHSTPFNQRVLEALKLPMVQGSSAFFAGCIRSLSPVLASR